MIPFPRNKRQSVSGEISASGAVAEVAAEVADVADVVNGMAERSAKESGLIDPSEASINIRDEEFFAADFEEEPIEEELEEDPELLEDMRQFSARRWKALGIITPLLLGCGIAAYFIMSSPYFGDGPDHLQVDRAALARQQEGELRRQAKAKREAAAAREAFSSGKKVQPGTVAAVTPTSTPQPPAVVAKTEPPAVAAKTEPPAVVAKTEPPAVVAKTEPPAVAAKTEPPAVAAKTEPPAAATGEYEKLVGDGMKLLQKRRRGRAYRVFAKAVKANPKGWEALQQMALYNMERGRMRAANGQAQKALAVNPNAPYGHLVKGAYLDERGKGAAARREYRIFLRLCPKCRFAGEIRRAVK